MEDKNQSTDGGVENSESVQAPIDAGGGVGIAGIQAGSLQDDVASLGANEPMVAINPLHEGLRTRLLRRADILLVGLLIAGGFALITTTTIRHNRNKPAVTVANQYATVQIPLSGFLATQSGIKVGSSSVVINGSLKLNQGMVISPSVQPSTPVSGQLYFDQNTNQLAYYNGATFVPLTATGKVVQTIGGASGNLTLGGGLSIVGDQLISSNNGVTSFGGLAGAIAVGSGLTMSGNTLQNGGVLSLTAGTPNLVISNDGNGNLTISNVGGGSGTITSGGGTAGKLPVFTTSQNIEDSIVSESGGAITVTGNATVTGTLSLGVALHVADGGTGANSLTANGVIVGNGISPLTSVAAGSAGLCLMSTAGAPAWGACPGGAGAAVTSLDGLTGALTIANSSGSGTTITINDANTAGTKGLATFNATNFTAASGTVNTVQNINTAADPTFRNLTLSTLSVSSSQAAASMLFVNNTNAAATGNLLDLQLGGSSKFSVQPNGSISVVGTINGQTISNAASFTGTMGVTGLASLNGGATVTGTLTANTITPTAAMTVGATGQTLTMQGAAATTLVANNGANATTISFQSPTANVNYRFVTTTAGNYDICTTAGNCTGVGGSVTTPGGTINRLAKFTGSQTLGDSILTDNGSTVTIAGTLAVNALSPTAALTIGATSQNLTLQGATTQLTATSGATTNTLTFATPSGAAKTITVPNASGTVVVSASGPLAIDGAGNITCASCLTSAVTSLNGQTGAVTIANASGSAGVVTINDASTSAKGIAQFNATNFSVASGIVNTIQDIATSSSPSFAQLTVTSSQATNGMFLVNNTNAAATGNLLDLQLNGTSKLSVAPSGNLTLVGTVNGQTISNSASFTGTLAVSGAASLNGGATVTGTLTANTITPTAAMTVGATTQSLLVQGNGSTSITATSGLSATTVNFQAPTANVTYRFLTAAAGTYDICTTAGNCSGVGGGVTTPGGTINKLAKFTASQTIGDSIITDNGSTVTIAGTLAVNTITPSAAMTVGATGQDLTLQGATVSLTATSAGITNTLTFATPSGTAKTITVPNASGTVAVSASGPLALDAAGNLTCATCVTSGGGGGGAAAVDSVDGLTGALTVANSSGSGTTITINDASTSAKGIAQFNSSNFSVASGIVNTIQDITTASDPTFRNLTLSTLSVASSQATNPMILANNTNSLGTGNLIDLQLNGASKFSVTPAGNLTTAGTITSGTINGQTISSSANFTGTVAVAGATSLNGGATVTGTLTANTITPTGALTVGATAQTFTLQGDNLSTVTATGGGFTTTVGFTGAPSGVVRYNFDRAATAGTYAICTSAGNCASGGNVNTAGGTTNALPKFTGATTLGDSNVSDDGTTVSVAGNLALAANKNLVLGSGTGTISQTYNATNGAGTTIAATNSAGSGTTSVLGLAVNLAGTNNGTGANTVTGVSFGNVTAATNNSFYGINFGTGFNDLLRYNGTQLISGAGLFQNAAIDSTLTYSNLTKVGALTAGSIGAGFGTIATSNTITGTTLNGTTGINSGAGAGTQRIDASGNLVNIGTITSGLINGQTISSSANFTGTVAVAGAASLNGGATVTGTLSVNTITPGAAFTLGATGQTFTLQGDASSTLTATGGGFTTTIGFSGTPVGAVTYNFDRSVAAGAYSICTTVGNCAGTGTGVTTSGGTTNRLAKFSASQAISNSSIVDNGTTVTLDSNVGLVLQGASATITNPQGFANAEAFGSGAVTNDRSVAVGAGASITVSDSAAVGYNASAYYHAVSVGATSGSGSGGTSVGYGATTTASATAIGAGSHAEQEGVAIGSSALVNNHNSIAIGTLATTGSALDSIALGYAATATAGNQFVVGANSHAISNVYIGNGIANAAPLGFTLQATSGSGTDIAGANVTLAAGQGTGAANGGDIILQSSTPGTTGATLNSLSTIASFSFANGNVLNQNTTVNVTNTSGTQTNGILFNRNGAGGTTTNGINITNTAGTLTNGLAFTGTIGTDIYRGSGTLTVQGGAGVSITSAPTATANGTGGALTLTAGDESSTTCTTACAGGNFTVQGGNATGSSGVRNGGSVYIDAGTGATSNGTINIGTVNSANVVIGKTTGGSTATLQAGGSVTLESGGASTTGVIHIGNGGAGSATPDFLGLDVKSTAGDPAGGANGYMYYNASSNKLRCFENGAWTDCVATGTSGTGFIQNQFASAQTANYYIQGNGDHVEAKIQAAISQTADIFQVLNSGGSPLFQISSNTNAATFTDNVIIAGQSSGALTVKSNVNGGGNVVVDVQRSGGASVLRVTDDGQVVSGSATVAGAGFSIADGLGNFGQFIPPANLGSNRNYTLPNSSGIICLDSGNCGSTTGTLQNAYNFSTGGSTSEIILDNTRGAVDIQDRSTANGGTLGANLFNARGTAANDTTAGALLFGIDNAGNVQLGNNADKTIAVLQAANGNNGNALTIQAGSGNGTNKNGGNLLLQGGNSTGSGTVGSVIVRPQTDMASAFIVQNNAATTNVLGVNTNTPAVVVTGSNTTSTAAFQVQNTSSNAILTADAVNLRVGIDATYAAMSTPTSLSVGAATSGGSLTVSTTYFYKVTSLDAAGGETAASSEASGATTSNRTLPVTWTAVTHSSGYKVYRATTSGSEVYITTVLTNSFTDDGTITAGSATPPSSTTAYVSANVTNNQLQLSVGGNGTPTSQLYVSGIVPSSAAGSIATGTNPTTMRVIGNYAYVTNLGANTFQIFNVANPLAPVSVSTTSTGSNTSPAGIAIKGNYAYIAYNNSNAISGNKLAVFNISNPNSPSLTGFVYTDTSPSRVTVQGNYAFVTTGNNTLQIFSLANPANPTKVSSITTGSSSSPLNAYVQGNYAYVTDNGSNDLQIFNISNPASPSSVSTTALGGSGYGVYVVGSYAYVTVFSTSTLKIFNISNPASPTQVSSTTVGSNLTNIMAQGRYVYIASKGNSTMQIVDVSNPYSPVLLGGPSTGTNPLDLGVKGNYAYVIANGGNVLQSFNLGGAYSQQLQVGGLEASTLQVGDATVYGGLSLQGGITVGTNAQINGALGLTGNLQTQGSLSVAGGVQGGLAINGLSTPGAPTVTPQGTTGATSYSYTVAAVGAAGGTTPASSAGSTGSGNATLSGANFNQITWTQVNGAVSYNIYRTVGGATQGLIGNTNSTTLNDTGLAASGTAPTLDSSGQLTVNGFATFKPTASSDSATAFQIQNAAGSQVVGVDTLNSNIMLLGNNSPLLGSWNTNANSLGLATPVYRAMSVATNGYIYYIGGSNGTQGTTPVVYARANSDGTTGSFSSTTSLSTARESAGVVSANGYVYLLGGFETASATNKVTYAKINPDGTLGSWNDTTTLPAAKYRPSAVYANGYIYVVGGGSSSTDGSTTVYYAKVNADGTVGSWTTSANTLGAAGNERASGTAVTANGYLYYMGGQNNSTVSQSTVYASQLNPTTGANGTFSTSSLPTASRDGTSVVVNGYVYVIGGKDGSGTQLQTVQYAKLNVDGTLGSWSTISNSLPMSPAAYGATSVVVNGYIYYMGGSTSNGTTNVNTVYYASTSRVQIGGSLDLVGIQGTTMADSGGQSQGSSGGSLTAGNGTFVGSLQVQGQATFNQTVNISGGLVVDTMLAVDVANEKITIGPAAGDTTGAILILGNKTNSGDPTGVNGAMYYNSAVHEFRCFRDSNWEPCGTNPIDRGFIIEDEFVSGDTSFATAGNVGSLGWTATTIGTGTDSKGYNSGNVTPSADHPGIFRMMANSTAPVASSGYTITTWNPGNGNSGAPWVLAAGNDFKTSVAIGSATTGKNTLRVGLHNETSTTTAPTTGVFWEADPTVNANWRYCYNNTGTPTCAASSVAIVANTLVRLEIRVNSLTSVTFLINGTTAASLTGITVNTTNNVSPAATCYAQDAAAEDCYIDYVQVRGVASAAR